jgi:hypothetical protein
MARRQCEKCPWKVGVDPYDIPNGYERENHVKLRDTVAQPGDDINDERPMMACHETEMGKEKPCVGWIVNQLGPGHNLRLRLAVNHGKFDADVVAVGEQHRSLEDTIPKEW